MSKENSLEKLNSQKFNDALKVVFRLLSQYTKDYSDTKSWVTHYGEILNVKFPKINFNESQAVFTGKIVKILDIMEMTHLYCKINDEKKYVKKNHGDIIMYRNYIESRLPQMTAKEFEDLKQHLENGILFGNN